MKTELIFDAKFIGQDGSLGYRNGEEYKLSMYHRPPTNASFVSEVKQESNQEIFTQEAEYESAISFLSNWTVTSKVIVNHID